MAPPILGRCIAGLAEATQVRLREGDDVDHLRSTVAQLAHALSAIGQVTADAIAGAKSPAPEPSASAAPPVVMMPPGLVNRAARYLEAAAVLVHEGVRPEDFDTTHADRLAATFMQDAASLRYYALDKRLRGSTEPRRGHPTRSRHGRGATRSARPARPGSPPRPSWTR